MSVDKLDSFFGDGTTLKGTLKFKGQLRFDGDFDGSIQSNGALVVGESGKVKAAIKSGTIYNFGKIDGDVKADYKIQLATKSSLRGNIEAPIVIMEEASFFEGSCKMPPIPKDMPKGADPVIHKEPPVAEEVDISHAPASPPAKKPGGWFGLLFGLYGILSSQA
jgi:cytoskeletal protein CcmA (bactofilin family)